MSTSDITLTSHGTGHGARLTLDGEDVSSVVTGLHLWIDPYSQGQHLELHLTPGVLGVELRDTHVLVDADTHDVLVRLGWTPPHEEQEATR